MQRTYLGDGAYCDYEGQGSFKLWCKREGGDHYVYLSAVEIEGLIHFYHEITNPILTLVDP